MRHLERRLKKNREKLDLRFPVSRQAFPESRELSMDDYYEFVLSNLALFGRPPHERAAGFQRFVIREADAKYFSKGDGG